MYNTFAVHDIGYLISILRLHRRHITAYQHHMNYEESNCRQYKNNKTHNMHYFQQDLLKPYKFHLDFQGNLNVESVGTLILVKTLGIVCTFLVS